MIVEKSGTVRLPIKSQTSSRVEALNAAVDYAEPGDRASFVRLPRRMAVTSPHTLERVIPLPGGYIPARYFQECPFALLSRWSVRYSAQLRATISARIRAVLPERHDRLSAPDALVFGLTEAIARRLSRDFLAGRLPDHKMPQVVNFWIGKARVVARQHSRFLDEVEGR